MSTGTLERSAAERIRVILESYSDNPSAFLALNRGNSYFEYPGLAGVIVYRETGGHLVQFGGPFAPMADYDALQRAFREFTRSGRRRVVAIQLQAADAARFADLGYAVNQVGSSYAVDLAAFTLRGKKFVRLRNKISRAARDGLTVTEVDQPAWHQRMRTLDEQWLASKGKHAKPLEFLVGEYGGGYQRCRRLFVGRIDGELAGYISYSPAYGSRPGWLHDLSRRRPDAPPGVMEAINSAAIDTFRAEGAPWLHFGFTPFTGLDPANEVGTSSRWFRWLVRQLAERGDAVYPAKSQLAYKHKWAPHAVLPEYVAFSGGRASLAGFLRVFKAANAL